MLKIGLTGGIGSGKSTVAAMLREKGIAVIDADIVARNVLTDYPKVLEDIRSTFGQQFFDFDGNLKRRELGNFVFRFQSERRKLDHIMIPIIKKEIFDCITEYDKKGEKLCVIDAPTLIEHNLHLEMDFNIVVWVDRTTQIARMKKRDNLREEQIADRLNSQMSLDEKKGFANFIIDNSSDILKTRQQVEEVLAVLKLYI